MKIRYSPKPCLLGDVAPEYWLPGDLTDDGAVKKPNGKYLSVQPDGTYQERDSAGGSYEKPFRPAGDLNVLDITPRRATFRIPYHEV